MPVMSAVFREHRHRRIIKILFNIIILSSLGIINDLPQTLLIFNYALCAFLFSAFTATRSAHHNIITLTAVSKTDRL
jgi:hypothetical protein